MCVFARVRARAFALRPNLASPPPATLTKSERLKSLFIHAGRVACWRGALLQRQYEKHFGEKGSTWIIERVRRADKPNALCFIFPTEKWVGNKFVVNGSVDLVGWERVKGRKAGFYNPPNISW